VGSQNFDWRALTHIHETGVRVRDRRIAAELGRVFELDWELARTGKKVGAPSEAARPAAPTAAAEIERVASAQVINPPGVRSALEALLELLAGARRSIRVQLLDYSSLSRREAQWTEIDDALRAAAARGVRVDLLVSHWNTERPAIDSLKALGRVPGVDVRIATIPTHSTGFIPYARVAHSKYMVVDDEILWIGTSNWSRGYFYASRNVELIIRRPAVARKARAIFETLFSSRFSERVDPAKDYPLPRKRTPEPSGKADD
jgi:phosphatidylserine/phosphatidylglycerophosphate/cardiolipin synthase-like enzyme